MGKKSLGKLEKVDYYIVHYKINNIDRYHPYFVQKSPFNSACDDPLLSSLVVSD
jgi:hypothetical protein